MSNPAYELHSLYAAWRERVTETQNNRPMTWFLKPQSPEGIAEIRRAYALLSTIDGILRRLSFDGKSVKVFAKQLDGWARVPLSLEQGWGSAIAPDHMVTEAVLDQLESFGAYLEGKVLVLEPAHEGNLRSVITRADALLDEGDLDPRLRQYLRKLLFEIRLALDDEQAGAAFDFAEAVQRLWVAFEAAAAKAPEEQRITWLQLAQQIFVGLVSGGAVEAATVAVGAIVS